MLMAQSLWSRTVIFSAHFEACEMKQLSGRALQIVSGQSELPFHIVQQYRARLEGSFELPDQIASSAKAPQRRSCSTAKRGKCTDCSNAGTLMMAAIQADTGQPVSCGTCKAYLLSLNRMSSHDHSAITQKLYAEISWPPSWRAKHGDRTGQQRRIAEIVADALAKSETIEPKPSHRPPRPSPASKSNSVLYRAAMAAPKPDREPFTDTPVFHFGAHLWPIEGCWEQHVDTWNKLASQITGRCIVGVAECEGCGTSPTSEVIARLSNRFEVFTVPNTKEGENPTFTELLKRIPKGENDVFLYAHGKGVKPATRVSAAVKVWIEVMYSTVTFNHHEIVRRMAQGYKTFGSLRAFGTMPLKPKHSWHYAGTFFAVRAKHLPNTKPVKKGYGGVEAWPGDNFLANEAWCEFGDNRSIMSHYNDAEMCSGVIEGAVAELRSRYAKRHMHRKLIAVTSCNLHGSEKIREDIRVALDSISEHCTSDVLVVDDGSPKEYQDYVRELCKKRGFRFVGIWNNGGVSHAKNLCLGEFVEQPQYEYLIMLDDDVKVISDEFESTYTTALQRSGVGILSWNDPAWVNSTSDRDGELMASNHTCGCCVVVSRECAKSTGFYQDMPGKWGLEHIDYYKRAAEKFGKPGVFYDVPNSKDLLLLVSHESVFTHEEKIQSLELNKAYLEEQRIWRLASD